MPAADRRSIGELVADSDLLARQSLFDLTPDDAPAMVRAWPSLAQAAASLFSVLPPDADSMCAIPMARIAEVGSAIGRSVATGHWPGSGPAAEAFEEITTNLTRAATMISRPDHGSGDLADQLGGGGQLARTQLIHAVYVTAHAVATALAGYQHDLEHTLRLAPMRREPHAERPNALEIEAAAGMRVTLRRHRAARHRPCRPAPGTCPSAITCRPGPARHHPTGSGPRCLGRAGAPHPRQATRPCRPSAGSPGPSPDRRHRRHHHPGRRSARRARSPSVGAIDPALEAAQLGWARTARRWGELTNPASRTDPALTDAAAELRAVIAAATANRTGWATPDQIAERVDLTAAMRALQLSMAAGLDLAYVNRDVAADHPGLAAPVRVIAIRALGEAEIAAEQGDTRYEGLTWATPKQIAANQVIPLPEPARRGLVDITDDVITAATHAVAVAGDLHRCDRPPPDRSGSATRQPRSYGQGAGPPDLERNVPPR